MRASDHACALQIVPSHHNNYLISTALLTCHLRCMSNNKLIFLIFVVYVFGIVAGSLSTAVYMVPAALLACLKSLFHTQYCIHADS
jgi:hypothetical protein